VVTAPPVRSASSVSDGSRDAGHDDTGRRL
jgi:hypothetical protein